MTKKFDLVDFINRGHPPHKAHIETIHRGLEVSENVNIILGSANQPRTVKNPFTVDERASVYREIFSHKKDRVHITCVEDQMYNDVLWGSSIQKITSDKHFEIYGDDPEPKIGIIGHMKDESSFYLKMFPQWEFIEQELIEPLSATDIREMYFSDNCNLNYFVGVLPPESLQFLKNFMKTPEYKNLVEEKKFIDNYKKQYDQFPYPPIFVTTDAVVIQSGHVLMIQRRSAPGKGLWALPGGFVNAYTDKSLVDAMIRELYEETNLKVAEKIVRGSIKGSKVFDAVGRSLRGRTITHAFAIVFGDGEWKLPKVSAADDAADCKWVPISELKRDQIFEDHFEIIMTMLGMI